MEPLLSRLAIQAAPRIPRSSFTLRPHRPTLSLSSRTPRLFSTTIPRLLPKERKIYDTKSAPDSSFSRPAAELSHNVTQDEKDHFSRVESESKQMQARSPWTREGSDVPPVHRPRSAGAMTKGKLLTTPSRMLKLVLPLTTRDKNEDRKDVEPLALLVHPQQPLSYLERLIQSELPFFWDEKKGRERPPDVVFRAEDSMEDETGNDVEDVVVVEEETVDDNADETMVDGKREKTGKISGGGGDKKEVVRKKREDQVEKDERTAKDPDHANFVRWSPSTEIGDFIRDAARGKEFAVEVEGAPEPIYVGVPSFSDRTYYLRMRLRKISKRISNMADVKQECDELAHRGAKQVARLGFGGLLGWWGAVYYCTFLTDLGWDVMEPNTLYKAKGFDLASWEMLIEEGNRLRREVKLVAEEYDVEWDEMKDEGEEKVRKALQSERKKAAGGKDKAKEKDDDDEKDD
ncbi:uncharacterized protein MYCGRDRAFT_62800 [Zymoseptoria tritici IPO323]|uniref:Calcium uniporter protein n=1 Tax=Zymoseptoria tritici (strain CBS 115943 / IPO323) TaxID=336722 RepID=F9XKK5_ZYMTI|nr:uncharacterized protein MYCGRDRAFT_62800 [Zymoseptoria tritici IPO323]EGP83723.1 hypothetical protein MYCGRDRAFT_62800 [Zymoseptoria tritici IPO323]